MSTYRRELDPEIDWTQVPGHCYSCGAPLDEDWPHGECAYCRGDEPDEEAS